MRSLIRELGDALIAIPTWIGRVTFLLYYCIRDLARLFRGKYHWSLLGEIRKASLTQIWFTGIQVLPLIAIVAAAFSGTLISLGYQNLQLIGAEEFFGSFLRFGILTELGPLLIALIVIARSGTAMTADVASQTIRGESDVLAVHGMSVPLLVIIPRLIGGCLSTMLLAVFFMLIMYGGLFFWAPIFSVNFEEIRNNVLEPLQVLDIQVLLIKSFSFGFTMGIVACYKGLHVKRDIRDLPRASSQSVVSSMIAIFILDALISVMVLL